jgi:hypothetical protein
LISAQFELFMDDKSCPVSLCVFRAPLPYVVFLAARASDTGWLLALGWQIIAWG